MITALWGYLEMTKMAIIKFFWILTAVILLIAAFAGLIVCIIVPAIRLLWGSIQGIIQHNRQRKEAIERYKSENPIFKSGISEDTNCERKE
jgi:hypothetical protein